MQSRITARCVPRRRRSPGRHCARAPRPRSRDRARRRASRRSPSPSVRKATMPSSVRTKRSSRGSAPVSSRTAASTAAVSMSISSPAAVSFSGSRCVCTERTSGTSARIAASTCSAIVVRPLERELAGKLQVERDLDARRRRRAPSGCGSRARCETVSAAASTRSRIPPSPPRGSTWTTTSIPGSASCSACSTRSAAACPWPIAAPGATPMTTSAKCSPPARRSRSRRSSTGGSSAAIA